MGSRKEVKPGAGGGCLPIALGKASPSLPMGTGSCVPWECLPLSCTAAEARAQAVCAIPAPFFFSTGQVDLDLLRSQQLKLYILKAGRALLSHQDQLRQILSQPAVQETPAAHTGIFVKSPRSVRKADTPIENRQGT